MTVTGDDPLAAALVDERPALVGLAYRITGSRVDAEDIVQEAWLRARRVDPSRIERPGAWLSTVVARLALDHLKSAQRRREAYVGPWLPEPVVGVPMPGAGGDPSEAAELAESVTFGFLRLLETLGPVERVVFLLADVFDMPFADIAGVVDRSPEACRQIASRARRRMREGVPRRAVSEDAERVVRELFEALSAGDLARMAELVADDAVLVSDGGPEQQAARRPVIGAERIIRFVANLMRRFSPEGVVVEPVMLNGEPGGIVHVGGERFMAYAATVVDGRVSAAYVVVNPEKLAALDFDDPMW